MGDEFRNIIFRLQDHLARDLNLTFFLFVHWKVLLYLRVLFNGIDFPITVYFFFHIMNMRITVIVMLTEYFSL